MTDAITGTLPASTAATGASIYTGSASAGAAKQEMDGDMFLKLLITQLSNQDPSSPMDSAQMVQQTAALAQMESLSKLTDTTSESFGLQMRIAAANLIGKEVTYTATDGTEITGVATAVSYKGNVPQVTVNDKQVNLDIISGVKN